LANFRDYGSNFAKKLAEKRQLFFGEDILKIITSVPGGDVLGPTALGSVKICPKTLYANAVLFLAQEVACMYI
jgi:hypothetical protein